MYNVYGMYSFIVQYVLGRNVSFVLGMCGMCEVRKKNIFYRKSWEIWEETGFGVWGGGSGEPFTVN